ncbi:MAG: HspR, transcriptional repressor of DnaK operon [uncultured Solirubrobacteraceae bacterium]|uniref:HspR, transcriptional repressor of DnaK operon n=1 Tax=uncultured Solirubrobacteraceae bacterium TaxID=1162706 RepID=A0A6J4RAH0_9ACTN|nr:MAG: HspR, transcriptional repressor of DnaK operon [uncultured Solirubrobacteraceae bacterium]
MSAAGGHGGVDRERGVFMISVAAELANMHPQTLRIYESKGLITPKRSPKGTRLYSQADVDRLRRIQEMTAELGMNLAGVEKVFALEQQLERMARRMEQLERRTERMREEFARDMEDQIEQARQSLRGELVRYEPRGTALVQIRRVDVRKRRDSGGFTS